MNGGTVSWASQRQPIIALSTTESEYIAACSAAKELIWIRRLLQGIGCDITKETELYIDNQAAIKLVENPVFHKRTKHIDVRYHFIRSKHEEAVNSASFRTLTSFDRLLSKKLKDNIYIQVNTRFKAGRISIEDDPRQGRPKFQRTDENVQKITDLIKENPRTTLLELEQDTGISKTTIGRIVTEDLKLKKTPAKFIPRFLTNEEKLCRLATCEDMMEMTRTDPEWKDKIITGDETWVYGYDPETKPQSAEWRG
ncbi:hypothetical protein LAZ67_18002684 [Cordylochernes scorpioides]|uniref:Uncharacterized protein n=1 Tax=Cordylochernes scorpioides TaxID=51811 RepID=A0ABY6LGV6_9ARAC|nr:hypothetical protein LAZ67_18002684 [Cordylochernes scorpioides]